MAARGQQSWAYYSFICTFWGGGGILAGGGGMHGIGRDRQSWQPIEQYAPVMDLNNFTWN